MDLVLHCQKNVRSFITKYIPMIYWIRELSMCSECERLSFIKGRDGTAIPFARQVVSQYRKAVLTSRKRGYTNPSHASLPEFRRKFIESYLIAKRYRG
jgi:hypothetical protein